MSLVPIYQYGMRRLYRAKVSFQDDQTGTEVSTKLDRLIVYHAVSLHDDWARIMRMVVYGMALSHSRTLSGASCGSSLNLRSLSDVAERLEYEGVNSRARSWHIAGEVIGITRTLHIENRGGFAAAVGSSSSPEPTLRDYRNYVVHRNGHTYAKLRRRMVRQGYFGEPVRFPMMRQAGGVTLFEEWVSLLEIVLRSSCE